MLKALIVGIGDELTLGQTVDTNSAWLAEQLAQIGVIPLEHVTVADDQNKIAEHLRRGGDWADVIMVSGGLGPTDDDLTRNALAEVLGVDLHLDEQVWAAIQSYIEGMGRAVSPTNKIQAMIPAGAEVLPNSSGTAPGMAAQIGRARAFFVPGVPREMRNLWQQIIRERVVKLAAARGSAKVFITRKLHTFGAGESTVAQMIEGLMERGRNPLVNCTVANGVVSLRINAEAESERAAREMIGPVELELRKRLGELVFGVDDDTLAWVVSQKLREKGQTVATAESCTGGMLAKTLTDLAGSSDIFRCGWVVYSNEAKMNLLGVDAEIIAQHGAVSEPVAKQLAVAARQISRSNWAWGITGIAGPGGGSAEKRVGLVYIALAGGEGVRVEKCIFPGDRANVRLWAVNTALNLLRLA